MADETTPYLGLVKPEVNGEQTENVWGFDLNANFDKIDAQFALMIPGDAPVDGDIYGRRQGAWSRTVLKTDFTQLQSDLATHTHTATAITDFSEAVDDRVATVLRAGANIVLTYDDVVNQLVIASTGGGGGGGSLPPDGDYGDIVVSASGTHWTLDLTDVTLPTGDYGDITVSPGKIWTIDPGVVTYPKIQNVAANKLLGAVTAGTVQEIACTAAGRALLDDVDAAAQRTTLGLGTAATGNTGDFQAPDPTLTALSFLDGTAGLIEETGLDVFVKRTIGIGAPTSIPTRADADTRYAQLDSPVFTGDARAVTPAAADNDTSIATTAFVKVQGYARTADLPADAPSDGNEYVRVNGAWRMVGQKVALTGTQAIIPVPDWADIVHMDGSAATTGASILSMQLSGDGTTFLASASSYFISGVWNGANAATVGIVNNAGSNLIYMTIAGTSANIPHTFNNVMNVSRPTTAGYFILKAYSNVYDTAINAWYTGWYSSHTVDTSLGTRVKSLRIFNSSNASFTAGSYVHCRWM